MNFYLIYPDIHAIVSPHDIGPTDNELAQYRADSNRVFADISARRWQSIRFHFSAILDILFGWQTVATVFALSGLSLAASHAMFV